MRKIFTFLFAALMSVGMYATTVVTITNNDFPGMDVSFTKDGVTVSADWIDNMNSGNLVAPGSFSTTLGNFTKIEVNAGEVLSLGEGWSGNSERQTWTGNASSVSFSGDISGLGHGITIMCTIEPAPAVPDWVKSGDEWDDATKTLTVNGNPVSNAYIDVSDIENLVISDAVTSIGDNAFENCNGLKSVAFGSSLASIGEEAFASCIKLESVTFPASLESIGKSAFSQCYALTSVTITNGLTSIGQRVFFNCEKLASVTIPSSVTSIGSSAFGNCKVLTGIVVAAENPNYSSADGVLFDKDKTTLIQCPGGKQGEYTVPNSVTSIGNSAFSSCYLLTSVEIPNSVGEIGVQAFSSCSELTSVTIGNGVTSIGGYAFYYCSKLASVTINATTPPTLGGSALNKTAAALTIYVPAESVNAYKEAWTDYADKIEAAGGASEGTITVTWNGYDLPSYGSSFTKDGVTLTCDIDDSDLYGPGTFTTDLGNFTKIVVSAYDFCYIEATGGWSGDINQKTWTGNAAIVPFDGNIYAYSTDVTIVFTIEPSGGETAVDNIQIDKAQSTKLIRNGMLLIEKNGKIYNVMGAEVK